MSSSTEKEIPLVFISYCWSDENVDWVKDFASKLIENGVDVKLDLWDLKPAYDANVFMEQMVNNPEIDKVLIISDKKYKEKADKRTGGVGTETQIITAKIYKEQEQEKFVVLVREKDEDGNAVRPTYYGDRIYFDFSDDDRYTDEFDELLRWIFDSPRHVKPSLGPRPDFAKQAKSVRLGQKTAISSVFNAIEKDSKDLRVVVRRFFKSIVNDFEKYRLKDIDDNYDAVVDSIEGFLPVRDEVLSVIRRLVEYESVGSCIQEIHKFFELLLPYMDRPDYITIYSDVDFDNYRFLIHEMFLHAIAILIKNENYQSIKFLLHEDYYCNNDLVNCLAFRKVTFSLCNRNIKLKLNFISLRASLLKERSVGAGADFDGLMQADFLLFIYGDLLGVRDVDRWHPITFAYLRTSSGPFELFSRAQVPKTFDEIKLVLRIKNKGDLLSLLIDYKLGKKSVPKFDFNDIRPHILINYDKLPDK